MSQDITRSHTNKIAIYNNKDTAFYADSGASEDMFPDYSNFNTYHRLSNRYTTLGDTTRLPIEVIGTTVYTLNGAPSSLATRSTLPPYKVRYTPSTSIVKYQGLESNPPIRMDHTFSSLTSSSKWKTPMTT